MSLSSVRVASSRVFAPGQTSRLKTALTTQRSRFLDPHSFLSLPHTAARSRSFLVQALQDIEVAHKKVSECRVELTLTVSPERTQEIHDDVLKKLQKESHLPGFRKGQKVPQALLVQSCGGEKAFKGEVLQTLIEQSAEKALEEWQGIAIEDSDRLESDAQELLSSLDMNKPFIFRISFDVMSDVKWLKPFQDLKIEVHEKGNEETDRRNVEQYIRTVLKQKGMQRLVIDRGMEPGDVAIMDFDFVRPDNREALPHLRQEKFRFDTDLPDSLGVMDKLTGIQVGDVREIDVKFPDSWEPSVYRGVEALATVTCHELFSWELPELTDDFVQSLGQVSFQTADEFRSSLLMAETSRRAESLKDSIQQTLMQELAQIVEMTVSETALMETAKVKYQTMLLEMQSSGKIAPAAMESLTTEAMLHNYMMAHRAELEDDQKAIAAMSTVFKELGLEVPEEELVAEVAEAERGFKEMGEEYDVERLREMAVDVMQNTKVVEWFIKNGNVTVVPYGKETAASA